MPPRNTERPSSRASSLFLASSRMASQRSLFPSWCSTSVSFGPAAVRSGRYEKDEEVVGIEQQAHRHPGVQQVRIVVDWPEAETASRTTEKMCPCTEPLRGPLTLARSLSSSPSSCLTSPTKPSGSKQTFSTSDTSLPATEQNRGANPIKNQEEGRSLFS